MLVSRIGLALSLVMTAMQMQYMLRNDTYALLGYRNQTPDRIMSDQPRKFNRGLPHRLYHLAEIVRFVQVPMPQHSHPAQTRDENQAVDRPDQTRPDHFAFFISLIILVNHPTIRNRAQAVR